MDLRTGREFRLRVDPLDLDATLGCGQTFRWEREPDGCWRGVVGHDICRVQAHGDGVLVESLTGDARSEEAVSRYLRISDDVAAIQEALSTDEVLSTGISEVRGLRLVKMDEWECLVSYVLATYANIPRIKRMIETLSSSFGQRILRDDHAFPSIDDLEKATVEELVGCGLGYRAQYVRDLCDTMDVNELRRMKRMRYPRLRDCLRELPGVGDKVADCVSLFGFGKLEAFPVDVWIRRALQRLYGVEGSYATLHEFAARKFGAYAGYAQEYLFYNERALSPKGGCVFSE
jgi:N-glycosylase/DNA lyase